LWILVTSKTIVGVFSGTLLGGLDVKDLDEEAEGQKENVEKEV
jgi:hypothetical protein